jgi:tRNA pseudouridine38-40 synthase
MKKARLALFIGYTGEEYNGMQWQKEAHVRTIENELVRKLHGEALLRTDSFIELVKLYKWSRAARTDKGVHALINGVSCVFSLKDDFWVLNKPA